MKRRAKPATTPRGFLGDNAQPPLPPEPTRAIPGTEEKKAVLEWRVANGYHPHHPKDYMEEKNPT
jgi:hypothetical protein